MREIKFRVWAFATNEYFYPNDDDGWRMSEGVVEIIPNTFLEQSTGLKDRNDVDVYEGDILSGYDGYKEKIEGAVYFNVGWGRYTVCDNLTLTEGIARRCGIIGNIHEGIKDGNN